MNHFLLCVILMVIGSIAAGVYFNSIAANVAAYCLTSAIVVAIHANRKQ